MFYLKYTFERIRVLFEIYVVADNAALEAEVIRLHEEQESNASNAAMAAELAGVIDTSASSRVITWLVRVITWFIGVCLELWGVNIRGCDLLISDYSPLHPTFLGLYVLLVLF